MRRLSNKRYRAIRELEASIQKKLKEEMKAGTLKEYMKTDDYWRSNLLLQMYKDC